MANWYMLTVVGRDQPGIVAEVTDVLFRTGCHLGEASMMRLGGNFTMMLMVRFDAELASLESELRPHCEALQLALHIDAIEGHLHEHQIPNVRVSVHGADRPGMVAKVTRVLQQQGVNILELESDVGGSDALPIFIMHIEGSSPVDVATLQQALIELEGQEMDIQVSAIETLVA